MSRKRKRKKSELKARAANIQQLRAKEQHVFMKLGAKLRAYFFTGILVTAPVSITFYMAYKIILWIDAGVGRLLPPQLKSYYDDLPFTIPGLGVIVLIVSMILIGMFAAGFVGSFFVRLGDWMVKKMPVISSVYSLLKQVFETPGVQPGGSARISAQRHLDFGICQHRYRRRSQAHSRPGDG